MMTNKRNVEQSVRDIRRRTRKKYSAEEKIRIVLEGLRGEDILNQRELIKLNTLAMRRQMHDDKQHIN